MSEMSLQGEREAATGWLERFEVEARFARRLAMTREQTEWIALVDRAVEVVQSALAAGESPQPAVERGEAMLAPLGAAAKAYTVHCAGHAHLDMNWRWNWSETVAATNDTFTTVERLMDAFPTFHFTQSQAEQYHILSTYLPELCAKVKARVREGRWEVAAAQWVEGDKNMASVESLCRQALYSRHFLRREFGLPFEAGTLCWEPDTFGHPHTLPGILARAGVKYYYFSRGLQGPKLFWWQGVDGSRLLAFNDDLETYSGPLTPRIGELALEFEAETGLRDSLYVYGVGDHGGGPTRRDLLRGLDMDQWPIFPAVRFSTAGAFFAIAEAQARDLPVIDRELNFLNEGCYTSESKIKFANRTSENLLLETEAFARLAGGLIGLPYPVDALDRAWHATIFNQFHDILPGSGIHETYEHALGLYQETLAQATMVKTRALRGIAGRVPTAALCAPPADGAAVGEGIGGGSGQIYWDGELSVYGAGARGSDPFVVFNPSPWRRSEMVLARIWDRTGYVNERIQVIDDRGAALPAQVVERASFDLHDYITVAFPARDVGGMGYRSYAVVQRDEPLAGSGCHGDGRGMMVNEFLRVEVEQASGAIIHLLDKRTGLDLVPPGQRIGLLEYFLETPHAASAWVIGQIVEHRPLTTGATRVCPLNGPHVATVESVRTVGNSTVKLTISLTAGVPRVDFEVDVNWLEIGSAQAGVPMLRLAFPLAIDGTRAVYECPGGSIERPTDPKALMGLSGAQREHSRLPFDPYPGEVPALRWADLSGRHPSGERVGATLLNEAKYGHNVDGHVLRLTLLRSSYQPDPLPELGRHRIHCALQPHGDDWSPALATRWGYDYNLPLSVTGATDHDGDLPLRLEGAELLTPTVMLSALKKAVDGDALIVRLYEMTGHPVTARLRLAPVFADPDAPAVETDLLEEPCAHSTARMSGGVLEVDLPPHGIATVRVG